MRQFIIGQIVIIAAIGIGCGLSGKSPTSGPSATTPEGELLQLHAAIAGAEWKANEVAANTKYIGKRWLFAGIVGKVNDASNGPLLTLGDDETGPNLNTVVAEFPQSGREAISRLAEDDCIVISATPSSFFHVRAANQFTLPTVGIVLKSAKIVLPKATTADEVKKLGCKIVPWPLAIKELVGKTPQEMAAIFGKPFVDPKIDPEGSLARYSTTYPGSKVHVTRNVIFVNGRVSE